MLSAVGKRSVTSGRMEPPPGLNQYTWYPLKLYFKIPCVFPVQSQIFPVPIYIICEYYIHTKLTCRPIQILEKKLKFFAAHITISFTFRIRELNQTKFPVFSLCFGKISKFPVFSLTGIFFCHFPCFPCAVGTLNIARRPRSILPEAWDFM